MKGSTVGTSTSAYEEDLGSGGTLKMEEGGTLIVRPLKRCEEGLY
jgi:hypothetical protein